MNMIRHTIDTIQYTLMVLTKTIDVHIEVSLVGFVNSGDVVVRAKDYVVNQFCVCHIIVA